MSPRKPAVLRDGDGPGLRQYLIETAARLIGERGSAGLAVRDIAREARVADGVLYNYFEDKEDLLAHALLAYVGSVMQAAPQMPAAGTSTVADNPGCASTARREARPARRLAGAPPGVRPSHAMLGRDQAASRRAAGCPGPASRTARMAEKNATNSKTITIGRSIPNDVAHAVTLFVTFPSGSLRGPRPGAATPPTGRRARRRSCAASPASRRASPPPGAARRQATPRSPNADVPGRPRGAAGGRYPARCWPKKPKTLAQPSIAASGRYIGVW